MFLAARLPEPLNLEFADRWCNEFLLDRSGLPTRLSDLGHKVEYVKAGSDPVTTDPKTQNENNLGQCLTETDRNLLFKEVLIGASVLLGLRVQNPTALGGYTVSCYRKIPATDRISRHW